jgi:beta-xylosidase
MLINVAANAKPKKKDTGDLNFNALLQPIPLTAKLESDSMYIWCASCVKGNDGLYHVYYSRWNRKYGFHAWVTHSEVAHATSLSPYGPFRFRDVALPARGAQFWDGLCTHNPTIHRFNGKYYLYYMGNTGDGKVTMGKLNFVHRNNQRIGVAVADKPEGPWKRSDKPLIDISEDVDASDALMTSNPSVTRTINGNYLMVYKAVGKKDPMPFGGPVVHLTATADKPEGPFKKQLTPIFTAKNKIGKTNFPAEDPYVWLQDGCYYAIVKDMHGAFTNAGQSLVLFCSKNGFDWILAKHPLVTTLNIKWENGKSQKVRNLERPQLYFENGKPIALFVAIDTLSQISKINTFNVQIPLK